MSDSVAGAPGGGQTTYVPVRVSTLRGERKIDFDIYVLIGEKHILYVRRGESFEGVRLERLKERKVRKMYIRPEDESNYRGYLRANMEGAYDSSSNQSFESRASVIQGLQQALAEAVLENPADEAAYNDAKNGASRFVAFVMNEEKALRALLSIENSDQSLAAHGVTVASLAIGIAAATGKTDPHSLQFLALGGLLHDLGHHSSGVPYMRPQEEMAPEMAEAYRAHPSAGAAMIKDLKHIDQHVTQIILEHEEHIDGSGFPKGAIGKNCNPLSVIVATANAYDRFVTFQNLTPGDAIKKMVVDKIGRHPLEQINALKMIVAGLADGGVTK